MSAGQIIKFLRSYNNLTQEELAEILNVKKSSIQKYEANDVPNLKIDTIRKLSNHFGIPANAFIFPEQYRGCDLKELINTHSDLQQHHDILVYGLNKEGKEKVFQYAIDIKSSGRYKD